MELNYVQAALAGSIASAIVWLVRLILVQIPGAAKYLTKETLTVIVCAVAVGLAVYWQKPVIVPTLEGWLNFVLVGIAPISANAFIAYNVILDRVLDGIGDRWPRLSVR